MTLMIHRSGQSVGDNAVLSTAHESTDHVVVRVDVVVMQTSNECDGVVGVLAGGEEHICK